MEQVKTDENQASLPSRQQLALERTHLASVRTEFALMRTGFTIASFGAGVTQFLGRNAWPLWATNVLTLSFVLTGMVCLVVSILRFRRRAKDIGQELGMRPFELMLIRAVPWALLLCLLVFLVLILLV